jgi:hypothetical protein
MVETDITNNSSLNKDIGYIDHEELVFNDVNKGIQSGGFSVSSIMMKSGISPIMTMNVNTGRQNGMEQNGMEQNGMEQNGMEQNGMEQNGGSGKVSDLFQNLAVPNWATMYNMKGGEYKEQDSKKHKKQDNVSDSDSDVDDDLHDKLLELVKERENKVNKVDKVNKINKSKKINKLSKKNITKRNKKHK